MKKYLRLYSGLVMALSLIIIYQNCSQGTKDLGVAGTSSLTSVSCTLATSSTSTINASSHIYSFGTPVNFTFTFAPSDAQIAIVLQNPSTGQTLYQQSFLDNGTMSYNFPAIGSYIATGVVQDSLGNLLGQCSSGAFSVQSSQTGANCSFNGQTVLNGASVKAYQSSSVPYGSTCVSQTRTCSNGVLSGSYAYASCSVQAAANCSFNGQTVLNGASVKAYQSSSVPYGSTCVSQTRTCSNGVLSGSYTYASCTVLSGGGGGGGGGGGSCGGNGILCP